MHALLINVYELLHGTQNDPRYRDEIYTQAFWLLVIVTLASASIFYYALGWMSARYVLVRHWVLMLVACCLLNAAASILLAHQAAETWPIGFGAVQAVYGALLFVALSASLKWGSLNARRTPW